MLSLRDNPITLTGIWLMVKRSSARGRDGGVLQLALKTSPGSYRVFSVKSCGRFSGNSSIFF